MKKDLEELEFQDMLSNINAPKWFIKELIRNPNGIENIMDPNYRFNQKFNPKDGATCDHRIPLSKGGDKIDYKNLAVCCYQCNQQKKNIDYDVWLKRKNIN